MASTPGMKNGWLNTNFPIRVEPVSSICTAPKSVGYVGNTKSADTAAKDAIIIYTDPVFSVVMPVSYTHLDVYKRQVNNTRIFFSLYHKILLK